MIEYQDENGNLGQDMLTTRTPAQIEEEKEMKHNAELWYRPGYIVVPLETWYSDERLTDGDVLLLSFILGYLKSNDKLYMKTEKLLFLARKKSVDVIDKQIKKLSDLGYIKKTTRSLLGGGRQRVITSFHEPTNRSGRTVLQVPSPADLQDCSYNSISNLSNTSLVFKDSNESFSDSLRSSLGEPEKKLEESKKPEQGIKLEYSPNPPVLGAPLPSSYGNQEINQMLDFLRGVFGRADFKETKFLQRNFGLHLVNLYKKIGKDTFKSAIAALAKDDFKSKNCNSLKFIYGEIKSSKTTTGFIEPERKPINPIGYIL